MDNPNYTTEHRKGQHLLNEERYEIEVRLKDGWSIYKIAKHLGRAYNTIKDEVERGTVTLYNGKVKRYKADQLSPTFVGSKSIIILHLSLSSVSKILSKYLIRFSILL